MRITYRLANHVSGLLVFFIAVFVYCSTIEPSVSFWDCGEFILSAYKLEVGHPPGAPFFMLTANAFTQLTGDPALAARMVNYMSALMSAATILLLFYTITHLCRKIIVGVNAPVSVVNTVLIIACGVCGSLAYTFSDTFWFSAVEGEVYAYSSLFTALVFWLILKWEEQADEPHSDRWLVLIAYLMGLSIGVHLLNLLCIPAIVLVWYFRKHPQAGLLHSVPVLAVSAVLIVVMMFGVIPGVMKVGGWFELLFVNRLKLPFNSRLIAYCIVLAAFFVWTVYESHTQKNAFRMKFSFLCMTVLLGIFFYGYGTKSIVAGMAITGILAWYLFAKRIRPSFRADARVLNTVTLCLMMLIAGYSSYGIILIRSAANPPMDQNSPEDIFTLLFYTGRGQYEQQPLLYGPAYSSEPKLKEENNYCVHDCREKAPTYTKKIKQSPDEKDSYVISGHAYEMLYAQNMLFPRMYNPNYAAYGTERTNIYKQWVDIKGKDIPYDRCGETTIVNMPTQWENLQFFIRYQLNFMYWRYFLWNFVGRQNDISGHGETEHGNWITGISLIDRWLVGDPELTPAELKENKGRNVYYALPLLMGIIGLLWQLKRGVAGRQSFLIVFLLFFMTGIAIIIYLNQAPMQVRERDYAYAGSFYAFTVWMGMGVAGIAHMLRKRMGGLASAVAAGLAGILIPVQMAGQTWDDHDRSSRYAARDFGRNFLMSAQESGFPILFNMGDNDTFPLWYSQGVEGFRTDVRTCNLSYLQTDWYIDQMKRNAYESPALPIPWEKSEYCEDKAEVVHIRPEMKQYIDEYYRAYPREATADYGENPYELKNILCYWARSENKELQMIPTDSIVMKLDREAILASGMYIPETVGDDFPEYLHLSLKGRRYLPKRELMMLEILSGCDWKRPVYVASSVGSEGHLCFERNLMQEGLLLRFTPFDTYKHDMRMDTENTYDLLMNKFEWGGMETPGTYFDETSRSMYIRSRMLFASLAENLIGKGEKEKAARALDYSLAVIPPHNLPHDYRDGSLNMAECYYLLGMKDKADGITRALAGTSVGYIRWYLSMKPRLRMATQENCLYHLYLLDKEVRLMEKHDPENAPGYAETFEELYGRYRGGV